MPVVPAILHDLTGLDAPSAERMARLAMDLNALAIAERAASRAVTLEPDVGTPRETLGLVMMRQGRRVEAMSELDGLRFKSQRNARTSNSLCGA